MLPFPLATYLCSVPINNKSDSISWIQSLQHLPPCSVVGTAPQTRSHQHQEVPACFRAPALCPGPDGQRKGPKTKLGAQLGHDPSPADPSMRHSPLFCSTACSGLQHQAPPREPTGLMLQRLLGSWLCPSVRLSKDQQGQLGWLEGSSPLPGKTGHQRNIVTGGIFIFMVLKEGTE